MLAGRGADLGEPPTGHVGPVDTKKKRPRLGSWPAGGGGTSPGRGNRRYVGTPNR